MLHWPLSYWVNYEKWLEVESELMTTITNNSGPVASGLEKIRNIFQFVNCL